jgi:hypothetical protein
MAKTTKLSELVTKHAASMSFDERGRFREALLVTLPQAVEKAAEIARESGGWPAEWDFEGLAEFMERENENDRQ